MVNIYVDNQLIDLYDDGSDLVALTYSITDIKELNTSTAGYSKTIKIPNSKRNQSVFGFPEDINSTTAFFQNERKSARVEVEGLVIIEGFVKFDYVDMEIKITALNA